MFSFLFFFRFTIEIASAGEAATLELFLHASKYVLLSWLNVLPVIYIFPFDFIYKRKESEVRKII